MHDLYRIGYRLNVSPRWRDGIMKTARIIFPGYQTPALLALFVTLGVSGCSQSSLWMARSDADHSTTVDLVFEDKDETAVPEFNPPAAVSSRSRFIPTGFTEMVASGDAEEGTARPLVPPAIPATGVFTRPISMIPAAGSGSSHQDKSQFTAIATSRKSLITLGASENLDEKVRNATGIVVLDFYADWCGPCRRQGTILRDMESQANVSNATIIKVNVDQHRQLARKYNVSGLPTLIALKHEIVVRRQVGLASKTKVASMLRL